ncbi:MAG: hypothetical protein ABJA16_03730, partial [Nakamurella sp.]
MATKSRLPRQGLVIVLVAVLVLALGVAGFLVLRPSGGADTADSGGTGTGTGTGVAGVVDPPV